MTDTVKLIVEIPKAMYESIQSGTYCGSVYPYLEKATPLDSVRAEIIDKAIKGTNGEGFIFLGRLLRIFDSIGKSEREDEEC